MRFSDIPAHEHVKERLRRMVEEDRIPHALLLEGPEGIGKLAMARAFAQYLHCERRTPEGDACGECQSCRWHQTFNHIDTSYVFPVVKPEGGGDAPVSDDFIQEWRDFASDRVYMDLQAWTATFTKKNAQTMTYVTEANALIHKLAFTSHVTRYRVVIWWLPERMNEETSNKLLKLLEEPYPDTIFILASNRPEDLLPTIYSRVQRIEMKRLPAGTIADILESRHGVDRGQAMAIAHIAEGSMLSALNNLHVSKESSKFLDIFISLMRLAYQRNVKELREWANELAALGREPELRFYDYAMRLLRENFVYNFNVPQISYLNPAEAQFSSRFARFINERNVETLMRVFNDARTDIAGNANGKIVNLDVAIKVIMLLIQK